MSAGRPGGAWLVFAVASLSTPLCVGRVSAEELEHPTRAALGAGWAYGLESWSSLGLSASLGYVIPARLYLGLHSGVQIGRAVDDDPIDRHHYHSLDVGYLVELGKFQLLPLVHGGALFFLSGRDEPGNFVTGTAGVGFQAAYAFEPVFAGIDARLLYVPKTVDRGDTGASLAGIPVQALLGAAF